MKLNNNKTNLQKAVSLLIEARDVLLHGKDRTVDKPIVLKITELISEIVCE